ERSPLYPYSRSPYLLRDSRSPQIVAHSSLIAMKTTTFIVISTILLPFATQEIIGIPTIRCTPDGVFAFLNTSEPFTGHIYLKGHYGKKGCHRHFGSEPMEETKSPMYTAKTKFRFDACPMRRKRQINPRGLIMSGVMVVAHHSTLLTYRDRAYRIECYYREDNNVVQTEMRVNSQSPSPLASEPIPLPSCQYNVEMSSNSSQSGTSSPAIVTIGDSVVHLWTCGDPVHSTIYCMQVHSCVADDGGSEKVTVIDESGCSTDEELLSSLTYPTPLRAFARSRVFKFADKSDINFACQIRLMMKQDTVNGTCPVPDCSKRLRRSSNRTRLPRSVVFDVVASPMTVLEKRNNDHFPTQRELICPFVTAPLLVLAASFCCYVSFTIFYMCSRRRVVYSLE
ncbi:hypothetical protein V3C99_011620, partial [Haemonchus contortus]|uniref:Endoglin CD105 antigen domain containing protein n=2 Tax=Haemonchus contortus TaxID=6289 RepID=A0A7I5E7S7_HAECO